MAFRVSDLVVDVFACPVPTKAPCPEPTKKPPCPKPSKPPCPEPSKKTGRTAEAWEALPALRQQLRQALGGA